MDHNAILKFAYLLCMNKVNSKHYYCTSPGRKYLKNLMSVERYSYAEYFSLVVFEWRFVLVRGGR